MTDQQHTPTTADIRNAVTRDESDWREAGAHFDRWHAAQIAAAEQRGAARAEQAIYELTEAIRLTVEYVGNDTLPPIDGWTWFDALRKHRPELAEHFEQHPQLRPDNHVTREIIADQMEGDDD